MSDPSFAIDYSGARGSNTGDEFHELWATRQALRLLETATGLTAITVEGMTVAEGRTASGTVSIARRSLAAKRPPRLAGSNSNK